MEEIHIQIEDSSPSIEHTLRPITYTSWLMGVGVAHPRKCHKSVTIILRIVYLVLCCIIMKSDMTNFFTFGSAVAIKGDIFELMCLINLMIIYVSTYYYIYQGIRQYGKWPELMDRIKELDEKIRMETFMNDRPVKNVEALAILTTFAWCTLTLIVHVLYYYFTNPNLIFETDLMYYFMSTQSLINSFVFDILVYVVYYRFQTINKLIGQLNELSNTPWVAYKIRRIREMHNGICDLVIMISDIHGFYLLFCSVNCLTMVISTLINIYIAIVEKNSTFILSTNGFTILYTTQFGLMCWICTLARREFEKTGIIIYAILLHSKPGHLDKLNGTRNQSNLDVRTPLEGPDSEQNSNWSSGNSLNNVIIEHLLRKNLVRDCVRNEINDFLIQLQHRRVVFTVCDYFEMGNALFCGFIGVIFAYLVIFIQFYQRPGNKNERLWNIANDTHSDVSEL
ncbi:uncharacterized protein LOC105835630 [Monomorium pharaonis]|uniref:uncharacterized protein LOC105835630 n=1 Tax=Monomorium pharaonis TaxID=307658 RepID=UPI0017461973|nr:uncharacterized protein LOC105835630 [Monomorium pharaonis]